MSTEPQVSVQQGSISAVSADAVVVNLFEGVTAPGGATGAVDAALDGLLSRAIADGEISGGLYETTVVHTGGRIPASRVVVVGLGKAEDFNLLRARRASGAAVRAARKAGARTVATIVHGAGIGGLDPAAAARATVEGALTALYRFDRYRTRGAEGRRVEALILVEQAADKVAVFRQAAQQAQVMARATNRAREWVNLPPNALNPTTLAEAAAEVARAGGLDLEILEGPQLLEAGMEALYSVGKGSEHAPRLIKLTYRGRDQGAGGAAGAGAAGGASEAGAGSGIDLALVGKGVTFDSGGLSLKPGDAMEWMKADMAGAAAVLAAAEAVAALRPAINVSFLIPAVENLPGGRAFKPTDILRTFSGRTIEVLNTDAEGRLILADAVAKAAADGAARIVDIATLTGAAIIALGHEASALISSDDGLAAAVERASAACAERVWRLPSWPEYREQFKSAVADLKNTAGRAAGTITGALIVGTFAEDVPWAHLDIAGTAWSEKGKAWADAGATGVGAATLTQLCLDLAG